MASGWGLGGLILILFGWLVQLYYSAGKKIFALSLKYVAFYAVGCVLLAIDGLKTENTATWILNLIIAFVALMAGYFAKKARPK